MIEKSTTQKALAMFFDYPSREFHLRELSRVLKLSMPTIIAATDKLAKEGLVIKAKDKILTKTKANRENSWFIRQKRVYNLERIYASGVLDYISKAYNCPKAIILFGSFSRGEDIENSDIDIAVFSNKRLNLEVKAHEKLLKRNISIHEINIEKISQEFRSNLANGVLMEGSW